LVYVVSIGVFSSVIMVLVFMLLLLEAKVVRKGSVRIRINDEEDKSVIASVGSTLLSALVGNGIFLPSACGGSGSCGQCRCKVEQGGGTSCPRNWPI